MNHFIVVRTKFAAIHCWQDCPYPEVAFLRSPHRHMFFVEVEIPVTHGDRDVEFLMFKSELDHFLRNKYEGKNIGAMSCEHIAEALLIQFSEYTPTKILVLEDNENGGGVYASKYY